MHKITKQKARRVRRALVALSDPQLAWIIESWLKHALQAWPLNESDDQALFALGYRLKDSASGQTFDTWDAYEQDEDLDPNEVELVAPTAVNWRQKITRLALAVFYRGVLWAAGEVLDNTIFTDNWGAPPGHKRSGYAFLDKLAQHLVLARK